MTVVGSVQTETVGNDVDESTDRVERRNDDTGLFLAALATIMRETIHRFEDTVGRISEMVVTQPGKAGRDLVVTLQDFDRLQQEFTTLGDVLARLSGTSSDVLSNEAGVLHPGHEAIASISMSDLKYRLMYHLNEAQTAGANPPPDQPEEAEEVF